MCILKALTTYKGIAEAVKAKRASIEELKRDQRARFQAAQDTGAIFPKFSHFDDEYGDLEALDLHMKHVACDILDELTGVTQ